jgi:phosphate transport system protein
MATQLASGDAGSIAGGVERLSTLVQEMGDLVGTAMERLMLGFGEQDGESCTAVIVDDAKVEAHHRDARDLCFSHLLSTAPMTADDLRRMTRLEAVAAEFVRMGDHCVSAAKIGRELVGLPAMPPTTDLSALMRVCAKQVHDVVSSLASKDPHRARFVASNDTRVDAACRRVFQNINACTNGAEGVVPAAVAVRLRLAARHIERVAEHARNVAEHLVDAETGRIEALV